MNWLKLQRRRERVDVSDMKKFLIPLALFLGLVAFLAVGLKRDPREIPSPLINKPAPAFSLPTLEGGEPFSPQSLQGKVWMLNVWATWCVACREEHPVLVAFARQRSAYRGTELQGNSAAGRSQWQAGARGQAANGP